MSGQAGGWSKTTKVVVVGTAVSVVAVGAGAVFAAQSAQGEKRDQATVVRVIDGDTIDAEVGGARSASGC